VCNLTFLAIFVILKIAYGFLKNIPIFAEKFDENINVFAQTATSFLQNIYHNIVFDNSENWQKIAENCDHNLEPRFPISVSTETFSAKLCTRICMYLGT
jgi:hypothetical protein